MRKNFFIAMAVFILFQGAVTAQSFYVRKGVGYAFPVATTSIGENRSVSDVYSSTGTTSVSSVEEVKASYGSGFAGNYSVGYEINPNFAIDLNLLYLMGKHYKTSNTYSYTSDSFTENDYTITRTSSKGFFFNPSFIFKGESGKLTPCGRLGVIAGLPHINGENSYYDNSDGISSRKTSWKISKGMAFGFQGAVGMTYKLTEKFNLFSELNLIGMSYYAGNYKLTESTYNGTDNLAGISVSQKEIVYKKNFDPTKVNIDSSKPGTALRESAPFSSLSVLVGLKYSLRKRID